MSSSPTPASGVPNLLREIHSETLQFPILMEETGVPHLVGVLNLSSFDLTGELETPHSGVS
jgi:hypothetical protein